MMSWATVGVRPAAVTPVFVMPVCVPLTNTISPAARPIWTTAPPLAPAAPGWSMSWDTVVPAGKPLRSIEKSAVTAVIVPAASLVRFSVSVAVPRPFASALVMAGTTFAGNNVAVNFTWFGLAGVGAVGDLEPLQPAARRLATSRIIDKRFIVFFHSKELAGNVEAEEPVAVVAGTTSGLGHRRAECVGEVELKQMPAYALFDAEGAERHSRPEAAHARRP